MIAENLANSGPKIRVGVRAPTSCSTDLCSTVVAQCQLWLIVDGGIPCSDTSDGRRGQGQGRAVRESTQQSGPFAIVYATRQQNYKELEPFKIPADRNVVAPPIEA